MNERVAVLISGRGSNLSALIAAATQPGYPAQIALVLSNLAGAGGLDIARAHGIPATVIPHRDFGSDRAAHEAAIHQVLEDAAIDLVCLAGYMRLLTPLLVNAWRGRMLNIHPSLLPAFPGLHTHERALAAGVKLHGCSVHLVTEAMDSGPILAQAAVPVLADDDAESLATRVLAQEHRIYPVALATLAGQPPPPAAATANLCNPQPILPHRGFTPGTGWF